MKKVILILGLVGLFNGSLVAQSLNYTPSIGNDGSVNNFKGGYTFSYATAGSPWNGALLSFGGIGNNYDCQISSDYGPHGGNHLSYRTRNGDANTWNSWNEIATKGGNVFSGNQIINGNVGIGTSQPTSILSVGSTHGVKLSIGNLSWANLSIIETGYTSQVGDFTELKVPGYGINNAYIRMTQSGNVGIGTANPTNKLDVNGTIHSKEVKVDMIGWSDFVFKKEYSLPTLEEVEKHIAEKGHLENIPSEEEVLKNGINLGEMNAKLLQKIEELTLYIIEQDKRLERLEKGNKL